MALASLPVPDPSVRPATAADLTELVRLFDLARDELRDRKGAWLWERADAPFADAQTAAGVVASPPWLTWIGEIDSVPVGCLVASQRLLHDGGTLGVIHGLFVEPGARQVGVADSLVLVAMEHFRSTGCVGVDSWALPGERETKNFYEAHGFTARTITVHHSFIEDHHVSQIDRALAGSVAPDIPDAPAAPTTAPVVDAP